MGKMRVLVSLGVRLGQRKLLLTQQGLSAPALPALNNGESRRLLERFGAFKSPSILLEDFLGTSETLSISAAL